jgi:ribonuclease HI
MLRRSRPGLLQVHSWSISTDSQYVTLHWKSWMRDNSQIQYWIHRNSPATLKTCTAFRALEETLEQFQITFIDCSLFLIG